MIFQILSGLLLILLGILAVPSLVTSRKPETEGTIQKIRPYQGWLGIFFVVVGLAGIFQSVISLAKEIYPIYWLMSLFVAVLEFCLGFVMGYRLIAENLFSQNQTAQTKGRALLSKLRPLQKKLGILAIIAGILQIIAAFD